jgi:hypothetical protein
MTPKDLFSLSPGDIVRIRRQIKGKMWLFEEAADEYSTMPVLYIESETSLIFCKRALLFCDYAIVSHEGRLGYIEPGDIELEETLHV